MENEIASRSTNLTICEVYSAVYSALNVQYTYSTVKFTNGAVKFSPSLCAWIERNMVGLRNAFGCDNG